MVRSTLAIVHHTHAIMVMVIVIVEERNVPLDCLVEPITSKITILNCHIAQSQLDAAQPPHHNWMSVFLVIKITVIVSQAIEVIVVIVARK